MKRSPPELRAAGLDGQVEVRGCITEAIRGGPESANARCGEREQTCVLLVVLATGWFFDVLK